MQPVPETPEIPESPVQPRLAVSVILLRRDVDEPMVFIQNRVETMDFAAGMVVFPGGRVDGADFIAARVKGPADGQRHVAAWRDCGIGKGGERSRSELAGILLAAAIREVSEETGALLTPGELVPWANWVTPPTYSKRFDTYFYLAQPAPSLDPRHQTTEAHSSHWTSVRALLEEADAGRVQLMRPTRFLLEELMGLEPDDGVFRAGRRIVPVRNLND